MGISFPKFSEGYLKHPKCIGSYDGFYKSYIVMDHDKHIHYKLYGAQIVIHSLPRRGKNVPPLSYGRS